MTDMDKLIFSYEAVQRSLRRRDLRFVAMFVAVIGLASVATFLKSLPLVIIAVWAASVPIVLWWISAEMLFQVRQRRYEKLVYRELATIPYSMQSRAMDFFGRDWELAVIECNMAHAPGDCPLCGAE